MTQRKKLVTTYKAWAGNWYRGGANWLENRLNNTLTKNEPHDDRAMMRDAMKKLNQAADEIDRLYSIEQERDALWATLIKVADHLGIDNVEARKAPGKPSDVYIAAIEAREQALTAQVAQLRQALTAHAMHSVFASSEERTAHAQKALEETD